MNTSTTTTARLFNVSIDGYTHPSVAHPCALVVCGIMTDSKRAERLNSALFHTFGRDEEEVGSFLSSFESYGRKCRELGIILWTVSDIVRFKRALKSVGIDSLDDGDGVRVAHQYFGVYAPKEERAPIVLSPAEEW